MGVQLSKEIGYIGVYFVRNKYRGKGVGLALWNAVWPSLHMNCSNICLASGKCCQETISSLQSQIFDNFNKLTIIPFVTVE